MPRNTTSKHSGNYFLKLHQKPQGITVKISLFLCQNIPDPHKNLLPGLLAAVFIMSSDFLAAKVPAAVEAVAAAGDARFRAQAPVVAHGTDTSQSLGWSKYVEGAVHILHNQLILFRALPPPPSPPYVITFVIITKL